MAPLVSTEWLGEQLHDEDLRIVDCRFYLAEPDRGHDEYLAGHIPGAKYLSLDEHLTGSAGPGRHPLPDPATFATTLQSLGICDEHTVIVYDQDDAGIAARLWWMLRSLGHGSVSVIDGGWTAWDGEARSTTTEVPVWEPGVLEVAAEWSGTLDRKAVAARDDLLLIDSRAGERYRGEVEPIDLIAGHIPGAFNIPYQGNTGDDGRFLSPQELSERFAVADTPSQLVAYCGSGVTACNNILAMEVAGITDVALYPGSWSDWSAAGGEVATIQK